MISNLPNAVACVCEPGTLSVRGTNTSTLGVACHTVKEILEFFAWFNGSAEANRFNIGVIDSIAQMAEIFLDHHEQREKHGLKAYGNMSKDVMTILQQLYFRTDKHIVLTTKAAVEEREVQNGFKTNTIKTYKPYFPGRDLGIKVPHLFDEILFAHRMNHPQYGPTNALLTRDNGIALARDRSMRLDEIEPPDLNNIINKITS